MQQDEIIVFESENGTPPWKMVKPEDVPDWVKEKGIMGLLMDGYEAHDPKRSAKHYAGMRKDALQPGQVNEEGELVCH